MERAFVGKRSKGKEIAPNSKKEKKSTIFSDNAQQLILPLQLTGLVWLFKK